MTHAERKALREKHRATSSGMFCIACKHEDGYPASYPCDVIKVLDYLDVVDPMLSVFPTLYSLDVPPESAGNPVNEIN